MPIQLDAVVHFTVTDPVLMQVQVSLIVDNHPFTSVTAPAAFNWPSFQGVANKFASYHLPPVGDYTFTSHANGSQAGTAHNVVNDASLIFIAPEPGTALLVETAFCLLAVGRRRQSLQHHALGSN
jgi:hypothetical protein